MSLARRTWTYDKVRKTSRKGVGFQAYVCFQGERFRKSCVTLAEARVLEADVRTKMAHGIYRKEAYRKTIADVVEAMLDDMEKNRLNGHMPSGTYRLHKGMALNYILSDTSRYDTDGKRHHKDRLSVHWPKNNGIGHITLFKAQGPDIMKLRNAFRDAGASFPQRSQMLSTLRAIFSYAVDHLGWAYLDPTRGMTEKKYKHEFRGKVVVPQKPHIMLLMKVATPLQKLLVQLTASTAMRVGEVMALRWENVLWGRNKIDVTHTIDGDNRLVPPKTESSIREIDMSNALKEMLEDLYEKITEENGGYPPADEDFIFKHNGKNYYHMAFYEKIVWPLIDAANDYQSKHPEEFADQLPEDFSWKYLRHFGISALLECGFEDVVVWTMAGHANFESIERTYGHIFDSRDRIRKLDDAFGDILTQ